MKFDRKNIVGYECRFAVHMPALEPGGTDLHFVKEVVHVKDPATGAVTQHPNVRFIKDYKRPYWVTKDGFQNHEDKKEWEELSKLNFFQTTQSDLVHRAANSLKMPYFKGNLKRLARSPFLYGADILSTACVKREYQDKYPELLTPYTLACFDTETDVNDIKGNGSKEIICATLSFRDRIVCAVQECFVRGQADVMGRLERYAEKYIGHHLERHGAKVEFLIVKDEISILREVFKRAHEWRPDFVSIWNIEFDMEKMLDACKRAGVNPAEIFADPSIPRHARFFNYVPGQKQKKTASGKFTPIPPPAQWHTAYVPASFYFIDGMCAYKHLRIGEAEEPSYSLDAILNKHLKERKLKFAESGNLSGIDLHVFMQREYPLEYVIYNIWDSMSMEDLNDETHDLSLTLPMFSGCSDFSMFRSQPRRRVDDLHFVCLKEGHAIGTTSDDMTDDYDDMTTDLGGWIVTLPAHLVADNGLQVIKEIPSLRTNIRVHVGDLDVSASYPNGGACFNISKATTEREIHTIEGIDEEVYRQQGINLSGGSSNALEFCTEMFGLPTVKEMVLAYKEETGYQEPVTIEYSRED